MDKVMMKCGHSANATTKIDDKNAPACAICGCIEVLEIPIDLTGRKAKCTYCNGEVDSRLNLAFFEYCSDKPFDRYYCGCMGWN